MYRVRGIQVDKSHILYPYFSDASHAANNMSNAALFRLRQVMTAMGKDESSWTDNEKSVIEEINRSLPYMNEKYKMPTREKWLLSEGLLYGVMVKTHNPDYYDPRISSQCAQHIITQRVNDMKSFVEQCKSYNEDPSKFTGAPKLPKYKHKGGMCTVYFTNQDCVLFYGKDGMGYLKFPLTKLTLPVGKNIVGRLKQVTIVPEHEIFNVYLTLETNDVTDFSVFEDMIHRRICAIDIGVKNLAAITNNIGMPCMLFKGGVLMSACQWYNKQMAKIQTEQTKGGTEKFAMTPEAHQLCIKRDNIINDFMHKTAKAIIVWCVANDIDTIIYGRNKYWKQEVELGKKNNQEFVGIPFDKFRQMLKYLADEAGICFTEQEESYTSAADFLCHDDIPVYQEGNKTEYKFSGMRNKKVYTSGSGTKINADLNGSANIGRKCIPDMYDSGLYPDFNDTVIIKHPDLENRKANRTKQSALHTTPSKSKLKRLRRKRKLPLPA